MKKKIDIKSKLEYLFEAVIIILMIIPAVLIGIHLDDEMMKKSNESFLNKYDSITAKLPVQEKIINFNDVPKRKYYDKYGILNVEF
jgi:hypothetical protein